jgi:hypothetical protein
MKTKLLTKIRKAQTLSPEIYRNFDSDYRKDAIITNWDRSYPLLLMYRRRFTRLREIKMFLFEAFWINPSAKKMQYMVRQYLKSIRYESQA